MPKKSSTAPDRRHERAIHQRASDELPAELAGKLHRIGVAAGHGGYELKEYLAVKSRAARYEVIDFGDGPPKKDDDYPDFIVPLARAVAAGTVKRGIGICGSGVGASVCANKVAGVRACLIHENFPTHRGITSELYGGGPELRLKQELLPGIGGWRLHYPRGVAGRHLRGVPRPARSAEFAARSQFVAQSHGASGKFASSGMPGGRVRGAGAGIDGLAGLSRRL